MSISNNSIFVPINGHEEDYSISRDGVVMSSSKRRKKPIVLKSADNGNGYMRVTIYKNNVQATMYIHRLIAIHFIPNPNNYEQINHKDGNKKNNSIENLEWCNHSQNMKHAYDNGLNIASHGENHFRSKLTNEQVLEIRRLRANTTLTLREIGAMFGVYSTLIAKIALRRMWKHI